ncbi:MAG: hypothetical protein ACYC1D_10265 [Acidimicrobiales bacterium]
MSPGVLFSQMEPPPDLLSEFHDWYETEHIPARMALEGFVGARRYEALQGRPRHLAIYELESLRALESPEYRQLKAAPSERTRRMLAAVRGFTRFTCEQVADLGQPVFGEVLSVVAFAVPGAEESDFDGWYAEHAGMLLEAPEWLRVRRYRVLEGEGGAWTHLALHELASVEVMGSPERARARSGPRREALAARAWFAASGRWLYRAKSSTAACERPRTAAS